MHTVRVWVRLRAGVRIGRGLRPCLGVMDLVRHWVRVRGQG